MLNIKVQPTGHTQLLEFVVTLNKNRVTALVGVATIVTLGAYAMSQKKALEVLRTLPATTKEPLA